MAVWGAGSHAERRLLPALAQGRATALAGITTRDLNRGARLAALHGCTFWSRPEQMLQSDAVDVVLVATPIGCHAEHGRAVLEAGKHLWCEKSLTPSERESVELIADARRRRLVLAEAFMFLHHPHFQQLQAATAGLGRIVGLTSRFFMSILDKPGFRHNHALGGGGLLDVGCYPVQAAIALLGDDLEVRYAGLVRPLGFEVDMMGHAVLASRSGASALLEWGFGAAYRNELTLCGEAGSIDVDHAFSKTAEYEPNLVIRDERGSPRTEHVPAADSFREMFTALAGACSDGAMRDRLYTRALVQAQLLERIRVAIPVSPSVG